MKPSFVKGQFFLSQIKRKTVDEWGGGVLAVMVLNGVDGDE